MAVELLIFGMSHKSAPLEVREKLAVDDSALPGALGELAGHAGLVETALIATCNRVEIVAASAEPHAASERALRYFNGRAGTRVDGFVYKRIGEDAVRHLFRVASGLDSMVIGEPQILGQVKEAFATATEAGTVGTVLKRCFDRALGVAKRVRTTTSIAEGHVSVSSIACDLAAKIFDDLAGRRVLLVGAGKMSELAARTLVDRGANLYVVNRSQARAESLAAAAGGQARALESLAAELAEADVVITSTASPSFVITSELMHSVARVRRFRPLFIIDIAVPRNVDPRIDSLDNVYLYDLDDLQKVSRQNLAARQRAVHEAEEIIEAEVVQFHKWVRSLQLTPTIVALRERFRAVVATEVERTLPRMGSLSDEERKRLEAMSDSLINKLLHAPLTQIKQIDPNEQSAMVEALQRLFDLSDSVTDERPEANASLSDAKKPSEGST